MLFGPDRFHPSADGYKQVASVLIPSCLAALDLLPDDEAMPEPLRREGILPVAGAGGGGGPPPPPAVAGPHGGGAAPPAPPPGHRHRVSGRARGSGHPLK